MKTTEKRTRQCKLCGKTIEYSIITEDGIDWCGHHRGKVTTQTSGYECNCTQYKRMCLNCAHYANSACTNKNTIADYQKKLDNEIFAIDVKNLLIKKPTKHCPNWELSQSVAKELFKCESLFKS